jgi:hypothetical protein
MGMRSASGPKDEDGPQLARADEVALEYIKQVITLAAGVLAISATFIESLGGKTWIHLTVLALSWSSLVISVFFGLQTISAIVKSRLDSDDNSWSQGQGKTYAKLCKYSFVAGIALFAIYALLSLALSQIQATHPY